MDSAIVIAAASLNTLLGLLVFLRNPKSATNNLFFLLTFDIVLWACANFFSLHPVLGLPVLFWMRLVMFLAVPQAVLFFLLMHTFPRNKISLPGLYLWPLIVSSAVTMVLTFSPYLFTDVEFTNNISAPLPGPAMPLFVLVAVGSVLAGLITLVRRYIRSEGLVRAQLRFILLGVLSMFFLILTLNFILVVVFQIVTFIALSSVYTFPFVAAVAYAIMRHKLMDIRMVVARTVSYTLLLFFVAAVYVIVFAVLSSQFFSVTITMTTLAVMVVVTMSLAFSFQFIKRFFEKLTDRVFYQDRYDTNQLIYRLARIATSSIHLEKIAHEMLQLLVRELRVSKAAFILFEDGAIVDVKSEGFDKPPQLDEEQISLISNTRDTIVFEQLEEGDVKQVLREMDIATVVHLRAHGAQVGILVLGFKESGGVYTDQDLNFLEIFAPEAAVVIQNTQSFEEIRRFSVTLQEEVHSATKDLQDANVKLQELDKLKDEFVSLASHELRTPMTAIRGSLSTILEGYAGDIPDKAREFLTAAYAENERLIRLVNNLLNISRIESGRLKFDFQPVDVNAMVEEVVTNLQITAAEKKIYLTHKLEEQLPKAQADEDKVKEVLINLIGNAIKHTYEGGITVTTQKKDDAIVVAIVDTGHGIAKEDHDLLFQKFSQIKTVYKKETGGTGLGLYISKKIINGHNGEIWFESEVGQGSTFYFSLPIAP